MAEAEHHSPSGELAEHEHTFTGFVTGSKLIILAIAALLINLAIIAFTTSTFFQIVGFLMIVVGIVTALAEARTSGSSAGGLTVVVISLILLVIATA